MKKIFLNLHFLSVILIICWSFGTGIFSDDFLTIYDKVGLLPAGIAWTLPLQQITHYWAYGLCTIESSMAIEVLKSFYLVLCYFMIFKFFSDFIPMKQSVMASLLSIFLPCHDSTVFWYIAQHIILSMSCLLYSFHCLNHGRRKAGVLFSIIGSFISYSSPATAMSLVFIFLLRKAWRNAFLLFLPNIVYMAYYIIVSKCLECSRLPGDFNLFSIVKQGILQVGTFADSVFGVSHLLKIFLPMSAGVSVLLFSVAVSVAVALIFHFSRERDIQPGNPALGLRLLLVFSAVLSIMTLAMFTLTGAYPQIAFNLGNRTTTLSSLILVVLLVSLTDKYCLRTFIFTILLASIFSTSFHWREWNGMQQSAIRDMRSRIAQQKIDDGTVIHLAGMQYSRMGPLCHIEFLSEHWVANAIMKYASGGHLRGMALNRRFKVEGEFLLDRKYNNRFPISESIWIYRTDKRELLQVKSSDLDRYIMDELPVDKRNWLQLTGSSWLQKTAVRLMPRLSYVLEQ